MRKLTYTLAGLLLTASVLSGCAGQPPQPAEPPAPASPSPQAPGTVEPPASSEPAGTMPTATPSPGAGSPTQLGPVYIDQAELVLLESFPVQVRLELHGSLPNPCSELVWQVEPPDEQGRIQVQAYSQQESELACIQVLQPLEETIPVGDFTQGKFSVWLNGELIGEFEL